MGVVEAALLVACGTLAAIVLAFFAEGRPRPRRVHLLTRLANKEKAQPEG